MMSGQWIYSSEDDLGLERKTKKKKKKSSSEWTCIFLPPGEAIFSGLLTGLGVIFFFFFSLYLATLFD